MRYVFAIVLCLRLMPVHAGHTPYGNIPPGTQLLRYLRCDDHYYLVDISGHGAVSYLIGPACRIDSQVSAYLHSVERLEADHRLGFQLYRTLFPVPVNPGSRLVICADGILGRLPFESLNVDTAGTGINWLVARASVLYTYSLQDFFSPDRSYSPNPNNLLFLAPGLEKSGLAPLPYARQETEYCSALLTGRSQPKCDLSQTGFLELAPKCDILHLATHAQADNNDPTKSCFFLSLAGKTDTIYADELQGLKLRAQLLVLSACGSSNSLARAFHRAGARNILAAAWSVPDKSCARITQDFYRHLRQGCDKSRALQLAKIDYLRSADAVGAEPYYWAGLVLYGDDSRIRLQHVAPSVILLADSLVLLAASLLYYLSKKYIPSRHARRG